MRYLTSLAGRGWTAFVFPAVLFMVPVGWLWLSAEETEPPPTILPAHPPGELAEMPKPSATRTLPAPPPFEIQRPPITKLHSFEVIEERGKLVYKIRVTPRGDILTIDAKTGKLLTVSEPIPDGPFGPLGLFFPNATLAAG